MNSILILIITYILNPILETSAGICAVKSMNHRSLRPTPADFFFYLGIILAVLLVPSEPAIFKWVFGLLLYLVYIFITDYRQQRSEYFFLHDRSVKIGFR